MKINRTLLETAFLLTQKTLERQNLPDFMKERWRRALEKANQRILEKPYFAWQPNQLTIVSIPKENSKKIDCRFYQVTAETCSRLDKIGYCQAFYEGFPCWHRAAFLLLGIYFEKSANKSQKDSVSIPTVNFS